uniref:Cell wall protein Awa1p-like n=2 Tax=Schistosoma mansoni TaxID=6183 RepID=A0A3Q0KL69_SCHMA
MSQVTNTTTGISNNNSNNTPWNRTPGKPGIGTGGTVSSYPTFSTPSNIPWSTTRNDAVDLIQGRGQIEGGGGQMWPLPSIFDTNRTSDRNAVVVGGEGGGEFLPQESTTDSQWATTPFSGQTTSNVSSLLGSPNTFPISNNHIQALNPWSFDNPNNNCSITAPRAITGQQLNNVVTLANTPSDTLNPDRSRRYMQHWTTLNNEQDLLNDDRSGLAFPLSSININNNSNNSVSGFGNPSDFIENQSLSSNINNNTRGSNKLSEFDIGQTSLKKSSSDIDSSTCDAEEAIRTAVNTTEPWGIHPVDQSTPWNCSEANGDCLSIHSSGPITGSPPVSETSASSRISGHNQPSGVSTIQPTGSQSSLHSRRLSSTASSFSRDLESNVWPSEPPNGTGIWESHYESLGERTARWHQNSGNSTQTSQAPFLSHLINPPNFTSNQTSHPTIRSRPQQGQLPPSTESFRGINRAVPGTIFPLGQPPSNSSVMNLNTRPIFGGNHPIGPVNSNMVGTGGGSGGGSSRNFPIANPVNLGSGVSWPYTSGTQPVDPSVPGINFGNKSRWPGQNMNRLPGKQQHPTPHVLPNMTSAGMRWPPGATTTHIQGIWPHTDQRRPGTVPGPWSTNASGMDSSSAGGFFNQPTQSIAPRVSQQIGTSEFPSSLTPARGVNQSFRTPQSAFYPPITPGFSSTPMSQRMFMSPQQHSHQLQQQSMIRAHVMRQLFNFGFTEDEIQPIFADTNTNVERALIDLRDRSGHPGIDELINALRPITSNLLPTLNPNDVRQQSDLPGQSINPNRSMNAMRGNEMMKSNIPVSSNSNQPTENLELSLQLLQQRETQILQTIVQLHSKHQDLNQKLSHIRSATNVPFATNPVIHELQLQAFQVGQQIDAQQAQLKHVRSQAGMLRQITMSSSNLSNPSQNLNTTNITTVTPSSLLASSGMIHGGGATGQSVTNVQHIIPNCLTGTTNPVNCSGFNLLTSSNSSSLSSSTSALPSSWCAISTQSGNMISGCNKTNQPLNISVVGNNSNGSESIDFLPDQSNFNMNSLLWESSPWSGSSPQLHENFPTNRNSLATDRRWTPSGGSSGGGNGGVVGGVSGNSSSRLPPPFISSQLSSLGDPRWSDMMNDVTNSINDTRRQSFSAGVNEIDELHNSGLDYHPIIPVSISSKSWLLAHNIPPHISVGMLKMTVSSALNNHILRSGESSDRNSSNTASINSNGNNNDIDFEIHPNMSARWVLLGLNSPTHVSIVHDTLEGGNSNTNNNGQQQTTGCYGSIKLITPTEALLHLQEIQSLASRLKGLNADGSQSTSSATIHSISQLSSCNIMKCDFNSNHNNNIPSSDLSGSNHLLIGINATTNNNNCASPSLPLPIITTTTATSTPANTVVTTVNNHSSDS